MSDVYTNGMDIGIQILGSAAVSTVDNGNVSIGPIEFDNVNSGFIETNYSGGINFYTEGSTLGAGNKAQIPTWAELWAVPF